MENLFCAFVCLYMHELEDTQHYNSGHTQELNNTCTTSIPFITLAKTVCLLSSQGVATVVIKNWDPLLFGPAFAIDTVKGLSCRKLPKSKWFILGDFYLTHK